MPAKLIQYRTHASGTVENMRAVKAVFAELADTAPDGLTYVVVRYGDRFLHIAEQAEGMAPLTRLAAFEAFRRTGPSLRVGEPVVDEIEIIGLYQAARRT